MLNVTFSPAPATLPSCLITLTEYADAFLKYFTRSWFSVSKDKTVTVLPFCSPLGPTAVIMYLPGYY